LHRLPIDVLKIDKSFIAGLGHDDRTAELVRTIVQLGNNLGVVVIAEGMETQGQHDCLRQLGCGFGQGFLFSAPVPAAEVEALVASGHFRPRALAGAQGQVTA
jgi:EAL domain-containing protein (putative c-di-GMP-specific phosphodiesterase class I)